MTTSAWDVISELMNAADRAAEINDRATRDGPRLTISLTKEGILVDRLQSVDGRLARAAYMVTWRQFDAADEDILDYAITHVMRVPNPTVERPAIRKAG